MKSIDELPLVMTATEINRDIHKCHPDTLKRAWKAEKIKGHRRGIKKVVYETKSVLQWLGLVPPDHWESASPGKHKAMARKAVAK